MIHFIDKNMLFIINLNKSRAIKVYFKNKKTRKNEEGFDSC
jgi:hypothetical protein